MALKLYEGDKEVHMMTLKEAAEELKTTVKEIRDLAKKTYLPIYDFAGGRVSSGDLDYFKEKLNGNLDAEYKGCCVQMKSDNTESEELDLSKEVKDYPRPKNFKAYIKELKAYNEHDNKKMYNKYGDTYWEFMLGASDKLQKIGFIDCSEAGHLLGGYGGELSYEDRWILDKVKDGKYYFHYIENPMNSCVEILSARAYVCMPKGQEDIKPLRLIQYSSKINKDDNIIHKAVYVKDDENENIETYMDNIYKRYRKNHVFDED